MDPCEGSSASTEENAFAPLERVLVVPQHVVDSEASCMQETVWIRDASSAYRMCTVLEHRGDNLLVRYKDDASSTETRAIRKGEVQPTSMTHYCADMCNLTELNEPSALHTVRCRYEHKLIHTLSGLFCVVVNPWQRVALYSTQMIQFYMEQAKVQQDMPPHVYSIAQSAYDGIVQCKSDQSILITGESGAGKTENTKKIIEYLICASDRNYLHRRDQCHGIDTAIISSSVALEAFSNAKTVHNNNSSRLGKFIRIDFDSSGKLQSARINCYMLEKSRVVSQNPGDRNFHIFYQFLSDAFPLRLKHSLGLKKRASEYRYLNQGGCEREDAIDDSRTAGETIRALDRLGFGKGEQQWIVEVVAASILLGEIRFGERQGFDVTYPEDMQEVEHVTDIMWLSPEKLVDALTQPSIRVGDNVVKKSQNLKKTTSSVAALAKNIYDRMFSWIVSKCNVAISGCGNGDDQRHGNFIGVLDMAGFEIMNKNSFEQFCINFTNEKLQQFFNHFLFVREQSEYLSENIEWDQVDYGDDLQQTIDMIEKPMGFLSLLQEECIVPNGSDSTLLEKLVHNLSKTNVFVRAKQSARNTIVNHFTIYHYAGQVAYSVDGWVEKNRDHVEHCILELMSGSEHPLIGTLFPRLEGTEGRSRRGSIANATVSHIYKEQLTNLMNTLNSTRAHFIRCIVPNYERLPFVIDGPLVLHQLRCNGVLEGIRICRRGYPNRLPFIDFIRRYKILVTCDHFDQQDCREAAVELCSLIGLKRTQFQIGRTRVFFRVGVVSELESRRKERIAEHIVKFQAWIRWFREQQRVNNLVVQWNATVTVQRNIRDFATAMRWPWYHLWMQVRELIPLERDRKRLQELEERNVELQKLYEMAVGANQRQEQQMVDLKQQIESLREQRSLEKEKTSELREDLKRNEDLLELMERKFDEQHTKIMRLNDALKDNMRSLERMEVEKFELQKTVDTLREKNGSERTLRENLERVMEETKQNSRRLEDQVESTSRELSRVEGQLQKAQQGAMEWESKCHRQDEMISELHTNIAELNDRLNTVDSTLHQERGLRHEYESEVEELEKEVERLKEELDRCTVQKDALKEQNRVKDTTIRKLERKLDDKTAEMDACVNELKKMHRSAQQELREKLEELKRKFTKLELESKQQRCKLETAFERESSVDSDYGRTATLSRYGSRLSVNSMNSSTMSLGSSGRALGIHRRETEPELHGLRHYEPPTSYSSHSMPRSPSKASLSRNAMLSNINQSSLDVSANLARSPSSSQLYASERKVAQLERELQSSKTDNQLLKREIEVRKTSLHELERSKDTLTKQVRAQTAELEKNKKDLHDEQIKCQTMELSLRKATSDISAMKHKLENVFAEGKDDLVAERKKHAARIEQLQSEHEMKIQQLLGQHRNREHLQGELAETRAQLDRALTQIAQLERMQKSQTTIGETWESQYRGSLQEVEALRDENAALKSKIRRQYKQIELLTQQSRIDDYVSDMESRVGSMHEHLNSSSCESSALR